MREVSSWYIIHTKPKLEKRVTGILEKRQIPTYLPEMNKTQYLFGRKRVIGTPLIPSLLFVFSNEQELVKVMNTEGVMGILYNFQKAATIKSREVSAMQKFLTEHSDVTVEKVPLGCTEKNFKDIAILQNTPYDNGYQEIDRLFLPSIGYCLCSKSAEVLLNNVA